MFRQASQRIAAKGAQCIAAKGRFGRAVMQHDGRARGG
jgi:hypothetical protein